MKFDKVFTLKELIVIATVLLVIFLFINIISYPGPHSRELAKRVQCQSNLGHLGRALAVYQNEFNENLPCPWTMSNGSFGSGLYNKKGESKITRFADPQWDAYENVQTAGLCLYMLVRFEGEDPKTFLCPSDEDTEDMILEKISQFSEGKIEFWSDLHDFQSMANLSYSYHDPWSSFGVAEDSPLLADKSNAYDTETGARNPQAGDFPIQNKDGAWDSNDGQNSRHGNSPNHRGECQNVLFRNSSVKRTETPCVGLSGDNIYTYWTNKGDLARDKLIGRWDKGHAQNRLDYYLGN
ncbi:MAG: hypothetical protein AMJ79_00535 [Phycisphaerae bacterium SM23_30]|nr:MAG: hypothetical protein AMJ79_00535 [Phycisphaerae bacterium SM23_30]